MSISAPPAPADAPDQGRSDPRDSELAEALLDAISAIRRGTRRRGQRPQLLSELTGAQLELVRLVRRNPDTSVAAAAAALRLAPNTVSTLVRELTELGVVVRRSDPADHRIARLDLSRAARQQTEAWRDRRVGAVGRGIAELSHSQRAGLARALPVLAGLADVIDRPFES